MIRRNIKFKEKSLVIPLYKAIVRPHLESLLLYEAYANESSQICPFLALRPEFHSNLRVILSTPRYCQSATFGRLTFCVYTLLFNKTREAYML